MQIHVIWYCVLIFHDRTNIVKCYELWFAPIHTTPLKRILHPKMDGSKTSVLLGWPMFRGYISFREGILYIMFITYTIICVMKNFHSYYQSRDKPFIFEISHCNRYFSRSIDTYTYNSDIILLSYVFFVPRRPRNTGLSTAFRGVSRRQRRNPFGLCSFQRTWRESWRASFSRFFGWEKDVQLLFWC